MAASPCCQRLRAPPPGQGQHVRVVVGRGDGDGDQRLLADAPRFEADAVLASRRRRPARTIAPGPPGRAGRADSRAAATAPPLLGPASPACRLAPDGIKASSFGSGPGMRSKATGAAALKNASSFWPSAKFAEPTAVARSNSNACTCCDGSSVISSRPAGSFVGVTPAYGPSQSPPTFQVRFFHQPGSACGPLVPQIAAVERQAERAAFAPQQPAQQSVAQRHRLVPASHGRRQHQLGHRAAAGFRLLRPWWTNPVPAPPPASRARRPSPVKTSSRIIIRFPSVLRSVHTNSS